MELEKEKLIVSVTKFKKYNVNAEKPYFEKDFVSEVTDYNPETKTVEIMIDGYYFISMRLDELNKISGYWEDE